MVFAVEVRPAATRDVPDVRPFERQPERGRLDDLLLALKHHTREAHERLERSLNLLGEPRRALRFRHVLERFFGFHLVWEECIAAAPSLRDFHRPRRRLAALRQDLKSLGRSDSEIANLPSCPTAADLVRCEAEALGSLYVMEGSTLGGKVIGRAIEGAAWLPMGGIRYFDPYGPRTGEMWRGFKDWLVRQPQAADRDGVLCGARNTFELLRAWTTS